jgi:Ni/Co efflux regulator RcnB
MKAMHRPHRLPVLLLAALIGAAPALAAPGAADDEPVPQPRQAKKALDDRADTRVRSDDVGKGTHFARKPLGPGAYFDDGNRARVHKYYEGHPVSGPAPRWQIGQALPPSLAVGAVPKPVLAGLPKVPPGHRYVQLGGDILLIAAGSRMVVDGIAVRAPR